VQRDAHDGPDADDAGEVVGDEIVERARDRG